MLPASVVLCLVVSAIESAHGPTATTPLAAELEAALAAPALVGANVAVHVERLTDGEILFGRASDVPLVPASNMKLVSTAAALQQLGSDYRFKTLVFGKPDDRGVINGPLTVQGFGDPWLVPERVWYLASRIYYAGVREVRGDLVVDDTYFDGDRMARGFEQDRTSNAYMAPMGALSVGFNAVLVHVLPGGADGALARVNLDPPSRYAAVEGEITTVGRGRSNIEVDVEPVGDRSIIKLGGRIAKKDSGRGFYRRVDNPPIYAGEVLRTALEQLGVKLRGSVKLGVAPVDVEPLVVFTSPRLAELIDRINKTSNNFMAEQVARVLGAEAYGAPASWEKSERAMRTFLVEKVGLAPDAFVIGNASGLHDVNRMTARGLVRVLAYMHQQLATRPEYVASLAVAGSAGTLAGRMRDGEARYMVRAKTGTLSIASALSGYVTAHDGTPLAFSIVVNDYACPIEEVWKTQDALAQILARSSGTSVRSAHPVTATLPSSSGSTVGLP